MPLPSPHLKYPARCFSLPCAAPWDIIESPSPAAVPAFLWCGRDENDVWFGLGWAGVFSSLAECRAALRAVDMEAGTADFAARCFAVCTFDAEAPLLAPWESFHNRLFVLPETLIRWRDGQADVMLIRPVFGSATHHDLHADFEAATALVKLLLQNSEPRRSLRFRIEQLSFDQSSWTQAVAHIQNEIRRGHLRKAVLARALRYSANHPLNAAEVLERLARSESNCYLFAHRMGSSVFLGATPERLFRLRESVLDVDSLAGTCPRGKTPQEDEQLAADLRNSAKELREQELVTDFLLHHLAAWSAGCVRAPEPRLRRLTHVQHLWSTLSAHVGESVEPDTILDALHPTPAVCGTPREAAMALVHELEPEPRGLYAGAVGWINLHEIEMAVTIRSALLCGSRAQLFAGAGIVADSDAHREWEETQWKMRTMQQVLGIPDS
jgi:menaquinone-specific isochorismate synthase